MCSQRATRHGRIQTLKSPSLAHTNSELSASAESLQVLLGHGEHRHSTKKPHIRIVTPTEPIHFGPGPSDRVRISPRPSELLNEQSTLLTNGKLSASAGVC